MVGIEYMPNADQVNAMFDAIESVPPERRKREQERYAQQIEEEYASPDQYPGTNADDYEEEEPATHYHVVAFINGCLNDYDSGPYDTLDMARYELDQYCIEGGQQPGIPIKPAGNDRYAQGAYIITIETCNEPCDPDADD